MTTTQPGADGAAQQARDGQTRPSCDAAVVNVVAAVLIVASIVPIWLAQKLSGSQSAGLTGAR